MNPPVDLHAIEQQLGERDPTLLRAAEEVDTTLIDWALRLGPFQRLDASARAARALTGWRRATSTHR